MLGCMVNKKERRAEPRFNLQDSVRLQGWNLPLIAKPNVKSRVEGKVENVSSGGLCLVATSPLKISEMLVGEIAVPGTQATIPTLLQVRWLEKGSRGSQYRAGLNYVLQSGVSEALKTPAKPQNKTH